MAKRKQTKRAAAEPLIGIFWFYKGDIIQFADPISRLMPPGSTVEPPFIDARYDHVTSWPQVVQKYPELAGQPYESVPRGRVTKTPQGFNLLATSNIVANAILVRQIMRRFNLPNNKTMIEADPHYEDPSKIDWDEEGPTELPTTAASGNEIMRKVM